MICAKARLLFTGEGSDVLNIGRVLLVLLLVMNAIALAIGYDFALKTPDAGLSEGFLQINLQLMVVLTVIIAGYFPTMKPKSELIKSFYPVNGLYALILNHTMDIFRPVYVYTVISLIVFYIYSIEFQFENFLITIIWMYAAIIADHLVKTTVYKDLPQPKIAIALFMTILSTMATYFVMGLTFYLPPLSIQYAVAITVIGISGLALYIWTTTGLEDRSPNQSIIPVVTSLKRFEILLINLYFRRKTTVIILAVVPVIKVLLLVYLYFFYYRIESPLGATELFYSYLLMTPALIYTYVHNNLAGFFREIWLSHDLCNGDPKKLAKTYTVTLLPVLFYDFTLSVVALYIIDLWSWKYILFYAATALLIHFLGMYSSIYHPRFIDRYISLDRLAGLKNNTSGLISFYCGLLMIALAIIIEIGFYIWFAPLAIILLFTLYGKVENYSLKKYKMFAELFRQR